MNQNVLFDVVVYGATSAGCVAVVQAARLGCSVALCAVEKHVGGMTSNGLGLIDIKNGNIVGGVTKEFFTRVWEHYNDPASWKWKPRRVFPGSLGSYNPEAHEMWVLEPHVAEKIFNDMLSHEKNLTLFTECTLIDVDKNQSTIRSIVTTGSTLSGKMFIDCSYEGDLLAMADVSYTVGRESNTKFGERHNGIIFEGHVNHKFDFPISPYKDPNDPSQGLLDDVSMSTDKPGAGDNGVQAYTFRLCLTDVAENRTEIVKPADYDESRYEILFRSIEAGLQKENMLKLDPLPNGKYDMNSSGPVSSDYVGKSKDYPDADRKTRDKIYREHKDYVAGLLWTLKHHPRVPPHVQAFYAPYGLAADEFVENGNWPHELYVRESRRMVSDVVIDENTVLSQELVDDYVALCLYDMDSHVFSYVLKDEMVVTEGGTFVPVHVPFPISYRATRPKRAECTNLLVPVCLSATHIGYGAVRMEPNYMVIAQTSAVAASIAVQNDLTVQDVHYGDLSNRLKECGQVLHVVKEHNEWKSVIAV